MLRMDSKKFPVLSRMEYLETEDSKPGVCRRAGLDCKTCVGQAARGVASLCPSLEEQQVVEVFDRLYADQCCQRMCPEFEKAYVRSVAAGSPPP